MSVQSAGGNQPIQPQGAVNIDQTAETKANVKQASQGMKEVMTNIKELSQELRNQQSQKTSSKEANSKLETQTSRTLDQLKEQAQAQQKQVQGQEQSQQAQLSGGKDAEVVAAAMAGLMEEEEMGDVNEKQKALEEKMEILMEHAEKLQDVELDNPDNNFELQQLFKNAEKFKSLKRREGQLNKQLEDLEINLKQQEAREELNKLPVDETTKKMREQVLASYDEQQRHQSQDQQDDEPENQDDDEKENKDDRSLGAQT
tara:strand:- start:1918 stop:2691 length:774 start_codon:yes stop_codon:yes gene_type:complete